jgi:hypothetical protein
LRVAPAEGHQLGVRAALDRAAAVEHHDLVDVLEAGQPAN